MPVNYFQDKEEPWWSPSRDGDEHMNMNVSWLTLLEKKLQ